jgi:uncharacterized protein (TIGR02145 family)
MNMNQFYRQNVNYRSVTIGNQVWMAENLNVERFRNGDIIPEVKSANEWERYGREGKPAWCYYDNDPENGKKYGKLYNWHAVNDPRGLAPEGWHIPSDEEWTILTDYFNGNDVAARKLKAKSGWVNVGFGKDSVSCNGTDDFSFCALPGGSRNYHDGIFVHMGEMCEWWSITEVDANHAWCKSLLLNLDVRRLHYFKDLGFSVRCVRDVWNR